ncbi:hypothetical protein LCGC14_1923050 [marine sediment metagenome]|uniref:Uncharacterized protein n=1 Tax=marine sediment metagenome TaxID=412755 RepID=A0A0F9GDL5_9ZZZZ
MPEIHMPEGKDVPTTTGTAWWYRFGALVVLGALLAGSYWAGRQPSHRLAAFASEVTAEIDGNDGLGIAVQSVEVVGRIMIFADQSCLILFIFDDTVLDDPQVHGLQGPPGVCQSLFESHFIP